MFQLVICLNNALVHLLMIILSFSLCLWKMLLYFEHFWELKLVN